MAPSSRKPGVTFHKTPNVGGKVAHSRKLRESVTVVSFTVEREAKRRAPVLTGRLRASIGTRITPHPKGWQGEIGTNVEYAAFQEFGTASQPARRYLGGALRAAGAILRRRTRARG